MTKTPDETLTCVYPEIPKTIEWLQALETEQAPVEIFSDGNGGILYASVTFEIDSTIHGPCTATLFIRAEGVEVEMKGTVSTPAGHVKFKGLGELASAASEFFHNEPRGDLKLAP